MSALVAVVAACVLSVPAWAASVLRVDSRDVTVSSQPAAVSYFFSANAAPNSYVVDASLDGFLFCNEFGPANTAANTSAYESVYLRPRHGGWLFGTTDAAGVTGSVTGIINADYNGSVLNIASCAANGTHCSAQLNPTTNALTSPGAALQCYTANAHGLAVGDTRSIFTSSFDPPFGNTADNAWVSIKIDHIPAAGDTDDTFNYTVTVRIPPSAQTNSTSSTAAPSSLATSKYILKEGYDASVFSDCNVLMYGQSITASTTAVHKCHLISTLPSDTTVPVVSAALFTNATTRDSDYSDNVAFGYPVLSTPTANLAVVVVGSGSVDATSPTPIFGAIQNCTAGGAGGGDCTATYAGNSSVQLQATEQAGSGYKFAYWSNACVGNGLTTTVNLAADATCTAVFNLQQYQVTATSADTATGTISPATQTVNYGAAANFTVTPASHYHVDAVSGDTCAVSGSGTSYSAANIQADCAVTASFAIDQVTVNVDAVGGGFVYKTGATPPAWIASYAVDYNTTLALSAQPYAGYHFAGASGCNGSADLQLGTYATGAITSACTVTPTFAANQYTVAFDSQGGSSVASIAGDYQSQITLPAAPTYAGYSFTGWNTAADGSGTNFAAGAAFTVPLNGATLYAIWTQAPN